MSSICCGGSARGLKIPRIRGAPLSVQITDGHALQKEDLFYLRGWNCGRPTGIPTPAPTFQSLHRASACRHVACLMNNMSVMFFFSVGTSPSRSCVFPLLDLILDSQNHLRSEPGSTIGPIHGFSSRPPLPSICLLNPPRLGGLVSAGSSS